MRKQYTTKVKPTRTTGNSNNRAASMREEQQNTGDKYLTLVRKDLQPVHVGWDEKATFPGAVKA